MDRDLPCRIKPERAKSRNRTHFPFKWQTFTMQGSGSIEDGAASASSLEGGGIVHMAARDIFGHIEKDPKRLFLVRVAFIESELLRPGLALRYDFLDELLTAAPHRLLSRNYDYLRPRRVPANARTQSTTRRYATCWSRAGGSPL